MAETNRPGRLIVDQGTKPYLPPFMKLRYDKGRDRWVLLAPERILSPDKIAVEILQLCDGVKNVEEISGQMAEQYSAPVDVIQKDVVELLQDLADKGFLKAF
ncbi:pyrroloquinoline quinone biosynthesis peptide chaperone PqqD [Methyloligella sp. 2.7D]|uniref:pyrroloquinoline quinone biosynthesis peptide chaperone PqqD n=1 Tax=unclassified Methyloligella TaxID=2625955 RepID=UPI00157E2540|nr:pyrroloquinoline quinone biosynthesis peptide chaperone PqqD [Methyloligella sp. GL2]QKP77331.1 pyrroloquinoline quinone biosynthesis peptide chaperone PqqD [Methyloligella sp. GL2]